MKDDWNIDETGIKEDRKTGKQDDRKIERKVDRISGKTNKA